MCLRAQRCMPPPPTMAGVWGRQAPWWVGHGKDQIVAVAMAACFSKERKVRWALRARPTVLAEQPLTGGGARFSLTSEKTHLTGHLPLSSQLAAGDKDFEVFGAASSGHVPGVAGTARCPVGCLRGSGVLFSPDLGRGLHHRLVHPG